MNYIDYIIEGVCFFFCALHLIHSLLSGRKLSKKIDSVCLMCGASLTEGEIHKCDLSKTQLNALYQFVLSLKCDEVNSNGS